MLICAVQTLQVPDFLMKLLSLQALVAVVGAAEICVLPLSGCACLLLEAEIHRGRCSGKLALVPAMLSVLEVVSQRERHASRV